jgi:NitT/TauT family transport system ATP-binding protein
VTQPPEARSLTIQPLAGLIGAAVDYRGRAALGPIDLGVEAGDAVAVVGPSGCGKSTALRLLAGLEQPTRGQVLRTTHRGETSLVFQAPTLAPWASALANVALPLELAGVDRTEARSRAGAALARVGLSGSDHLRPAQLSGGMAMRASLARALVTRPRVLLLDEPFAALDEITRRRLADDVLALWSKSAPALVFVTHNVEEAVYMARRVVVLTPAPGRIAASFEVDAPLPRPPGFRMTAAFRDAAERVSAALEAAVTGSAA